MVIVIQITVIEEVRELVLSGELVTLCFYCMYLLNFVWQWI